MDPQLWQALSDADRHSSLAAVKRLYADGVPARVIIDDHLLPSQRRMGDLWLTGERTVAQEHAATAVNEALIRWLGSFTDPPSPDRPLVVVSCFEREWHSLPALVVAEHLVATGYRVSYLGPSPEPGELVREVMTRKPRAVLLSASLTSSLARHKQTLRQIHALGIPVVVGGQGFGGDPGRAIALGATAWAADPADAVRLLDELPLRGDRTPCDDPTPSDDDAAWIEEHRAELVSALVARLDEVSEVPDPVVRTAYQWSVELAGLCDHLVGCVSATLVTGDETVLLEAHAWLATVMHHRGVDGTVLVEAWSHLAEVLRGRALARELVASTAGYAEEAVAAAADGGVGGALTS